MGIIGIHCFGLQTSVIEPGRHSTAADIYNAGDTVSVATHMFYHSFTKLEPLSKVHEIMAENYLQSETSKTIV